MPLATDKTDGEYGSRASHLFMELYQATIMNFSFEKYQFCIVIRFNSKIYNQKKNLKRERLGQIDQIIKNNLTKIQWKINKEISKNQNSKQNLFLVPTAQHTER